jgi:chromosome partitioning protein
VTKRFLSIPQYIERYGIKIGERALANRCENGQVPGAIKVMASGPAGEAWRIPVLEAAGISEAPMRVIAIANQSGGAGKSTTSHNLAHLLAQQGLRVLAVDADQQCSLTEWSGVNLENLKGSLYDALVHTAPLPILRLPAIDLLPGHPHLAALDMDLAGTHFREHRLHKALDQVRSAYDVCIIDCPLSMGIISVQALYAADFVLVPVALTYKVYLGLQKFMETLVDMASNIRCELLGFIPFMYENTRVAQETLSNIRYFEQFAPIFEAVPKAMEFQTATLEGKCLAQVDPYHPALKPLHQLTDHLMLTLWPETKETAHA